MKFKKNTAAENERKIQALIFDLDGVLTQTQHIHKKAWKISLNEYLKNFVGKTVSKRPVDDRDYKIYIDGKPRYDGVKSFLESRDIELPFGDPADLPSRNTICGVGNRKNQLFNELIDQGDVKIYQSAIKKLKKWRKQGFKTAVVTSSKNCQKIIQQAGIAQLFDVKIDGITAAERNLKGKPDPDIFWEAARDLDVKPAHCVVFEDAISGVQAAQKGYFGLVVGVDRFDNETALRENHADIIIKDFEDFELIPNSEIESYFNLPKPLIFSPETDVWNKLKQKEPVFFLDYDGTLTPIVNKPEDAVISQPMKQTLKKLANNFTVAIITGRDTEDIKNLLKLDQLIYAGSHGYSISGPYNLAKEHEKAAEIKSVLNNMERELLLLFKDRTEGVQVERKSYAIALHYRNARDSDIPLVYNGAEKMLENYSGFKLGEGKKVVEIKPDLEWHKGKAVNWIMKTLDLDDEEKYLPLFIGDDITDEDAFRTLSKKGLTILVGTHGQNTAAQYSLKNVFQVKEFFETILKIKKGTN